MIQSRRGGIFLALVALLLPVIAACDSGSPPTAGPSPAPTATGPGPGSPAALPATPTAAPGGGGTLRWSNEGIQDLDTLDPALANASNSIMAMGLIFEGLVRFDSRLNIQPAGAERWEISDDGRTYTFHIRPGLLWADGSPVTAEDFRWSIERALAKENSSGAASYYLSNITGAPDWNAGKTRGLSGVTVKDPQTLQIHIDTPGVYFLYQISFAAADVIPKKLVDQYGKDWVNHAWGTGPFKLKEWKHNERLLLEPNPYYWRGAVALDGIDMPFIQDPKTAYDLYRTGGLDIMGAQQFPNTLATQAANDPDFKQEPQFFDAYVGFNNKKSPLDNVKLRQALAQAVDKQTLASKILGGGAVATDHLVPPGMPGYFPGLKPLRFDPGAAQQQLAVAGFPAGAALPKLSIAYTTGQSDFDKVATTLQQMWKQNLGITVQVQGEEQAKFNDDLTAMANNPETSTLQLYISVWGADYPDPQNFLSQQLHTGVGNNNGHYSNPTFDKLTEQADVEKDPVKRMDLYHQAEQIAVDEVGWLPLYNTNGNLLLKASVHGLVFTAQGLIADDWTKVTNKP
ncbi:MAG TPA: peptide ABC transporter substrate-binding protein [Chloroflexia bacterium]|nr:peptide ABC transporter substrate-binding protein [Chloroflexia bacterium]